MDGWMEGGMDGWMDVCMDGGMDELIALTNTLSCLLMRVGPYGGFATR